MGKKLSPLKLVGLSGCKYAGISVAVVGFFIASENFGLTSTLVSSIGGVIYLLSDITQQKYSRVNSE